MHQVEFLRAISETGSLVLCEDVDHILDCINKAERFSFKPYVRPDCWMDKVIIEFIEKNIEDD